MTSARPRIADAQRRARVAARLHLGRTAAGVGPAVRSVVALHSSDPITPHLALWARVPGYQTAHLDEALCGTRTLWRTHAMRRTLFVVPSAEREVFDGAASRAVARKERQRLEAGLERAMGPSAAPDWLGAVEQRTLDALRATPERSASQLAALVPELATTVTLGSGKWAAAVPLSSRLLILLAMEGRAVRTRPAGSWRSSQYRWAAADQWLPATPGPMEESEARAHLLRGYLGAYGPATLTDVRWWTGWTAGQAKAALEAVAAVPVELDAPAEGWVLPADVESVAAERPTVALLPGLDPAAMGWKQRDWYLGAHGERLYDRNGNAGPSIWVDGRIVGAWAQRPTGEVVTGLVEAIGQQARRSVDAEAAALTAWLGGTVVSSRFPAPLEQQLSATGPSD